MKENKKVIDDRWEREREIISLTFKSSNAKHILLPCDIADIGLFWTTDVGIPYVQLTR